VVDAAGVEARYYEIKRVSIAIVSETASLGDSEGQASNPEPLFNNLN
jgi:hypothetical protein